MDRAVLELLGIEAHRFRLSRPAAQDERSKYVDDPQAWSWAEGVLRAVLEQRGLAYEEAPGHAAFYGPKIDIQVRTLGGAEETLSTVQLDFAQPRRLGLSYTAASGRPEVPLCIHRAPLSTHERFVAFLLELYAGAFPTWLAPVQVRVIPVSDRSRDYGERIVRQLRARLVRAELDSEAETVARRIREAAEQKIPNVLVVGPREAEAQAVTLRRFGREGQVRLGVEELERRLLDAIARRLRCVEVES